jgi:transcriptional regulator with XRE-family HTH domain
VSKDRLREAVALEVVRLLKEVREKQGLSMNAVAERSGLSQSMVSLVERDLRNPTLDVLLRIGDALGVEIGEIITRARRNIVRGK